MKEAKNTNQAVKHGIRRVISSVAVISLVLAYPLFSLVQVGGFLHHSDSRSSAMLPVMTQRKVDTTTLPAQLFQEPLITVTFDDGFESVYNSAMPLLQKYGVHTTQYVIGGKADDPLYVSWTQILKMQEAGHEIGCHSMTHRDLTTLAPSDLHWELSQCKSILESRFGTVPDFASPYGAINDMTRIAISQYFDSQRNTNGDPTNGVTADDINTADNFNRYNIIGVTMEQGTTIEQLKELVAYTKAVNGWLVITYHQADLATGSKYAVAPDQLDEQLSFLSKTNVRIVTMHDALAATRLQNVEY